MNENGNEAIDFEIAKLMAMKIAKDFNYSIDHKIETGMIDLQGIALPFLNAKDASYTSKLKVLEGALEYFVSWYEKFKAKQSRLLIEGQTLESASANCDEATSMDDDPLDFSVATQALAG